jgi:hypothetical protein
LSPILSNEYFVTISPGKQDPEPSLPTHSDEEHPEIQKIREEFSHHEVEHRAFLDL